MKILGVDTSTKFCSMAIMEEGRVIASRHEELDRLHSSRLIPNMDEMLKDSSLTLDALDGFAVGLGPGSFTGLRVGITTMRGVAIGCDKPIAGISSLDCIARSVEDLHESICVILDARRGNVYTCIYKKTKKGLVRRSKQPLLSITALAGMIKGPTLFVGDGIRVYKKELTKGKQGMEFAKEEDWYPKAKWVAGIGEERLKSGRPDNAMDLVPLYMYHQECQVKK